MYEVTVERTLVIEAPDEDTAVNRAIERLNDPGDTIVWDHSSVNYHRLKPVACERLSETKQLD